VIDQPAPGLWCLDDQFIHAGRVSALIHLRHPPHADERVGVAPQHEPLQRLDLIPVAVLGRPEDALP